MKILGSAIVFTGITTALLCYSHPLDAGLLEIVHKNRNHYEVRLELHPSAFAQMKLSDYKSDHQSFLTFLSQGKPCSSSEPKISNINDGSTVMRFECECPAVMNEFVAKMLQTADPNFKLLVRMQSEQLEWVRTLDRAVPKTSWEIEPAANNKSFIIMGMQHIGVTPNQWMTEAKTFKFPPGLDHILFVVVLILNAVSLRALIKLITGFTLGHALSLILGTYGVISFSGGWVEVGIAFSILYLALLKLIGKPFHHGIWLTLGFGILHGLGFAGSLLDLHLPSNQLPWVLFHFNLGIEIAQVLIVIFLWPLYNLLLRYRIAEKYLLRGFSLGLAIFSAWWVWERILAID